jgi:hypothetical protein
MISVIVSVRDTAAEAFGRPMYLQSLGVAIRSFTDEVNREDKDNQLFNHPDDFDLYELGVFDDSIGKYEIRDNPSVIVRGKDVKIK